MGTETECSSCHGTRSSRDNSLGQLVLAARSAMAGRREWMLVGRSVPVVWVWRPVRIPSSRSAGLGALLRSGWAATGTASAGRRSQIRASEQPCRDDAREPSVSHRLARTAPPVGEVAERTASDERDEEAEEGEASESQELWCRPASFHRLLLERLSADVRSSRAPGRGRRDARCPARTVCRNRRPGTTVDRGRPCRGR